MACDRYAEHLVASWPVSVPRGTEVDGVDVVMLDAEVMGLAINARDGRVDVVALGAATRHLRVVVERVPVAARPYFQRLMEIAEQALASR